MSTQDELLRLRTQLEQVNKEKADLLDLLRHQKAPVMEAAVGMSRRVQARDLVQGQSIMLRREGESNGRDEAASA